VVFIPTYRRTILYGRMRESVGRILRELCEQKGLTLLEGHAAADPIHLLVSIPPKYSVSYTVGFLKGKSAVRIHRELLRERRMAWCLIYVVERAASATRLGSRHDRSTRQPSLVSAPASVRHCYAPAGFVPANRSCSYTS
jgi:REP element-mobilizing transposase RayT